MGKQYWWAGILILLILIAGAFVYYKDYYPYSGNAGEITERDLYCKSYYGIYNQKKIGTPDDWVYSGAGKSSTWHAKDDSQNPMTCDYQEKMSEQKCLSSGGNIEKTDCYCSNVENFPNLCLVGVCSCNPNSGISYKVNICDCGEGKCWDGEKCVSFPY